MKISERTRYNFRKEIGNIIVYILAISIFLAILLNPDFILFDFIHVVSYFITSLLLRIIIIVNFIMMIILLIGSVWDIFHRPYGEN